MLKANENKAGEIHKIRCMLQANKNKEAKMTSSYILFCLHRHLNSKKQQKLQLISRLFPAHYSHITLFPTSAKENNLEAIVSSFFFSSDAAVHQRHIPPCHGQQLQ